MGLGLRCAESARWESRVRGRIKSTQLAPLTMRKPDAGQHRDMIKLFLDAHRQQRSSSQTPDAGGWCRDSILFRPLRTTVYVDQAGVLDRRGSVVLSV